MTVDTVSILEGNSFLVSNRLGDLDATPTENHGLFLNDTRFLSRWLLTIDGRKPTLLSVDDLSYHRVQHFLALSTGTVYVDSHLSVVRRREIGRGFDEVIELDNHAKDPVELTMRLDVGADFADLFEVKDKLEKKGELYRRVEGSRLVLGYRRERFSRETWIEPQGVTSIDENGFAFKVQIAPQSSWSTHISVIAVRSERDLKELRARRRPTPRGAGEGTLSGNGGNGHGGNGHGLGTGATTDRDADLAQWVRRAPRLVSSWEPLGGIYKSSLVDLAALRFKSIVTPAPIPAAGLPWFMAIFGRDSLITSFQALTFMPELAAATLRTLAVFQGRVMDPFRDVEPGKILHELRLGEMTAFEDRPHSPYYGSADATPLFLIVLEEYVRWTGDRKLAEELRPAVGGALAWIDQHGDRDGDGYVEYERRNTTTGLENQCWKDSWDSIAFANGTLAPTPRATCEIQGYVYDAKRRVANLARDVYGDPAWATRLDAEAEELKRRFNRDFWIPERGFFALALDGQKRKVDSLTSNIGHLLWSGIADEDKARRCVEHLMGPELFSGWGIRTMGTAEGSYNPIGYHVGTVWPHDNSIAAWGLSRYGYRHEAARLSYAILEAAELFHGRLPEAFGGYPRTATRYPVEYPTACSPQAWATAAPLLLIRTLLGLDSDGRHLIIDPLLPDAIERLELLDVPGVWGRMDAFGRARHDAE